jgi:predicted DCC family thiol-disulfide oxidoreductase YuxK
MVRKPGPELTVFYDGACPLCRREINFLRRSEIGNTVDWHDVSDYPGDMVAEGLTKPDALARFHVRTGDGDLLAGAAAFVAVWSRHPKFGRLARALSNRLSLFLLDLLYRGFLFVRPLLQRIARSLSDRTSGGANR